MVAQRRARRPEATLWAVAVLVLVGTTGGCLGTGMRRPACLQPAPSLRGGVTLVSARCQGAQTCLLGYVVASETSQGLPGVAVFLERESGGPTATASPTRFVRRTDDQGVFAVTAIPKGRYRLAAYHGSRAISVQGVALGQPGTTLVPIRMPAVP